MKVNGDDRFIISGKVRFILTDVKTGKTEISRWYKNLMPTAGRQAVGRRLGNIALKANEGMVTYGAVGTGTTAPNAADVKLETEICRKLVASADYSANVVNIRTFFATSEAVGDLKEFGLFGEEASAVVDTGTLFQHVAIDRTKTDTKTLTIESEITISQG